MPVVEEDIDNSRLIEEVEGRPLIYNKQLKEYSDVTAKSKAWEEICQKLFLVWGQLSTKDKTDAGKLVQKRWKNIRSCFTRELRDQKQTKSGQAAKNRRKYKYFDNLLFLIPSLETRETSGNILSATDCDHDSDDDVSEEVENTRKRPKKDKSTAAKPQCYEEKLLNILQEKKQANTPITPSDKETHFALSLVPLLQSIPEESQLDIQIEILQIFKRAQQRNSGLQPSDNFPPRTIGDNSHMIRQKPIIVDASVNYQPSTSYRIIPQKIKVSDARYRIIQPRRTSTSSSNSISLPASSPQMSLPATSSPMSLPTTSSPISLPTTSPPIFPPTTSPQNMNYPSLPPPTSSPESMTLQSYLSNFIDSELDTDDSQMYDVCYEKSV